MIAEPPLEAPDDDWLVWADAMQQLGDPRGELIALAPQPARRDAFAKRHADALLGPVLGRHLRKGAIRVTRWRRYLPDDIELRIADDRDGPPLVVDVLRHAPRLRGLAIAGVASQHAAAPVDLTTTLGWLRESQFPPSLVSLALVDDRARTVDHLMSRDWNPDDNLVVFGPLAPLWRTLGAQLEELTLVVADPGQIQFQLLRLPELRAFTLRPLCWVDGLADLLANAHWPKLSSLELRMPAWYMQNNPDDARAYRRVYRHERDREPVGFDVRPYDPRWLDELGRLGAALGELPLERVALTSWDDPRVLDLLDALPPTVRELDFSDSAFDRAQAELLANHPIVLQLERLVLERVRLVSPRALAGWPIEIEHSCAAAAPTYRFITTME